MIAVHRVGAWRGALLEGLSGVGKSDLALRAVATGWRLAADDRVLIWTSDGRLFGRAPSTLRDLLEVRGVGVLPAAALRQVEIVLVAACESADAELDRVPIAERRDVLGLSLPVVRLRPCEPSALAKLELALEAAPFDSRPGRRI